ncbi:MAG: GGDEF domain-containing protein [Bdellovibrionales bacterium]|nr:GGDEF domain-containing protein [Bdellovibrionales bacterium]
MSDDGEDEKDISDKTSVLQSVTFKLRLAQAGQAPPSLVLLVGPASSVGRQWPIEDSDRIIGRSPSAHIYVDDRSVSKSHAKLILGGGDVSILDLESTNKTVVNGKVLQPLVPIRLANNDQIKTGNVIFKFLERGNVETVGFAQTYDRSQRDPLTGISNRAGLNVKAAESFKRSNLLGIPFSLIVFDIDHFKKVNDTYGHLAGDYVLAEISSVISNKLIRENDFFARTGGEEFCLLLLGSSIKIATEVAERIRHTIESHNFVFEGQKIPITISAGVALKIDGDPDWEPLYDRADKALYVSKRGGRNKVTVASE